MSVSTKAWIAAKRFAKDHTDRTGLQTLPEKTPDGIIYNITNPNGAIITLRALPDLDLNGEPNELD